MFFFEEKSEKEPLSCGGRWVESIDAESPVQ
jgi:hypothetical protein